MEKNNELLKPWEKTVKNNKIIITIIIISIFAIYFLEIRPSQIRKECSIITKQSDSYQSLNPEYSEAAERQKQKMLVDYIQCRNYNHAEGDEIYVNKEGYSPYPFTQEQYNNLSAATLFKFIDGGNIDDTSDANEKKFLFLDRILHSYTYPAPGDTTRNVTYDFYGIHDSLEELDQVILGKLSPLDYHTYNGYIIDNIAYENLKENAYKYPLCSFPGDFIKKHLLSGGGEYTTNASDAEYKTCLSEHGLMGKKELSPKEIRKDKILCNKWYGKKCDDPNFNPEY